VKPASRKALDSILKSLACTAHKALSSHVALKLIVFDSDDKLVKLLGPSPAGSGRYVSLWTGLGRRGQICEFGNYLA
jgi:hypothetical protein